MCYYENLLIEDTMKCLQEKGCEIVTLMFDELMRFY